MNENNQDFEQEYDSFKDVAEFQNNMFNPGHYVGTGKVPPTVSAPGNAMPMVIFCFLSAIFCFAFGLFISNVATHLNDKIGLLILFWGVAIVTLVLGFAYLRKAKEYRKQKTALENEHIDENVEDKIWQRTCPKCNKSHDIDYPKCPYCDFNYLE